MGDDEDWVSDTGTVDGDTYNKINFSAVEAEEGDTKEAPVKGGLKTDVNLGVIPGYYPPQGSNEQSTSTPSYNPLPPVAVRQEEPRQVVQVQQQVQEPVKAYARPKPMPVVPVQQLEVQHQQEERELIQAKQIQANNGGGDSKFKGISDKAIIAFFDEMNKKTFTEQAVEYLNAYWDEVGDQAEFIFSVAHKVFTEADMHRQGITIFYKYEEGSDVDYPTYLYFYEKLCKFVQTNPQWRQGQFEKSAVYDVKTAIKHKKELQEKVDVNFDGRISFLEYLLYQYNTFSNPAQFMQRAQAAGDEHPAIIAARLALEEVNRRIKAYEAERARLEEGARQPGVPGLTFKHQLAVLDSSPLAEELNKALITAEAAVRIAARKFAGQMTSSSGADGFTPRGALWWMQRDLEEKKKYGRQGRS